MLLKGADKRCAPVPHKKQQQNVHIVTRRLKAGIAEQERKYIASQRLAKHTFPQQRTNALLRQHFDKYVSVTTNIFHGYR
jgi:hypothetical protein